MTLSTRIANVQTRINTSCQQAERDKHAVKLLAVSKTRTADTLRQAYNLGLTAFGENYVQEALEKQQALQDCDIEWHFIGPIQSNKTSDIARSFKWIHSIDRIKLVKRLAKAATHSLQVCIQINISDEASKSGCKIAEIGALAAAIDAEENLQLRGLMAIPAASDDIEQQRRTFAAVKQQFVELQSLYPNIDTLSMGMSADLNAAILEGATIVRIGTDIFGPRNYRNKT